LAVSKKWKKRLLIHPLICLLCAIAAGFIYYAFEGVGWLILIFDRADRTDMMQAETYTDPNGLVLPYRIYVPESGGAEEPYPLVLFLHGSGERGSDNRAQTGKNGVMQTLLSEENRAEYPCVVLAPQCPEEQWWSDAGVPAALMGLLERTKTRHPIDPARVYITGLSMGGFGTWSMLAAYPDYFAAAIPVCGGGAPEQAPLFHEMPIWVFHGSKDKIVNPQDSRDMVKALEEAGAKEVKYTEYPTEGHQSWEKAWREINLFPWLFSQSKTD
jgi:predicted peptidase